MAKKKKAKKSSKRKAAPKRKAKKSKKSGATDLIVGSKIRALIKSKKGMTSSEFLPALNAKVSELVIEAVSRAKANKRTTLRGSDL